MTENSRDDAAFGVWRFLGSMRFGVWLLVTASFLSLAALLAGELLPESVKSTPLLQTLQMADPFRSWWFRALIGLLGVSLTVCIIQRGPGLIRQAFKPLFLTTPAQFSGHSQVFHQAVENGDLSVEAVLGSLGLKPARVHLDKGTAYAASSGSLSRIGPLLVHLGMLLLIVGGLVTGLSGRFDRVSGAPGDTLSFHEGGFDLVIHDFRIEYYPVSLNQWVETPSGRRGQVVKITGDSAQISFPAMTGAAELKYFPRTAVRNDFMVSNGQSLTPYQGNIRSYITEASALVNGQEALKRSIEVNQPFRFRGYRFYQSSFDYHQHSVSVDSVVLIISQPGSRDTTIVIAIEKSDTIALSRGLRLTTGRFLPDFRLDEQMHAFSASGQLNNPALRVTLQAADGETITQWVFQRAAGHMSGDLSLARVQLVDFKGARSGEAVYSTVLDVYRSPGTWLVWAGLVFATLGLILGYSLTQRKVWALVEKHPQSPDNLWIAWKCGRESEGYDARVQQVLSLLRAHSQDSNKNV